MTPPEESAAKKQVSKPWLFQMQERTGAWAGTDFDWILSLPQTHLIIRWIGFCFFPMRFFLGRVRWRLCTAVVVVAFALAVRKGGSKRIGFVSICAHEC
jgi:hypothetical protein